MDGAWFVRAGEGNYAAIEFEEGAYVAIGWHQLGNLSSLSDRDAVSRLVDNTYPDWKPGKRRGVIGMVSRFLFEMSRGDPVLTYNSETRLYLVGEIAGDYCYQAGQDLPQRRKAVWRGTVARDSLSVGSRNTLGAIQALFVVDEPAWEEISAVLQGRPIPQGETETRAEVDTLRHEVIGRAHEFIKDKLLALDWEEMQEFVAGLLRAMGYRCRISTQGPDRGKDIVASPDGLGLEPPRIRVEVKHRAGSQMGSSEVRAFIGGLRENDRGLYVSTGGFTREAHYEAERSSVPVSLLDLDGLVKLLVEYYDSTDTETRALVPLTRVYWPAE